MKPPAAHEVLRFSHKKTLILAHFFIEKGHAMMQSLWTMQKIFPQLMSQSRGLAKISERRPQPLLVGEIVD